VWAINDASERAVKMKDDRVGKEIRFLLTVVEVRSLSIQK